MTKWHYTVGNCLTSILKDGIIKPADTFVPEDQRPIVWFSTAPDWEYTANKAWRNPDGVIIPLTRKGTAKYGGGLVRIGVAPYTAPYNWGALKQLSPIPPRLAKSLRRTAERDGADPKDWWGTFDPVPRSQWISIQRHVDGQWVDIPPEEWK